MGLRLCGAADWLGRLSVPETRLKREMQAEVKRMLWEGKHGMGNGFRNGRHHDAFFVDVPLSLPLSAQSYEQPRIS